MKRSRKDDGAAGAAAPATAPAWLGAAVNVDAPPSAVARGRDPAEPKRPALCCGCHDTFQGMASSNLPYGRYLCEECHASVTCYVCNTKRAHPEEGELQRCDNCCWRAAHYGCLGFRTAAPRPWYCFRCEQPASRAEQARAIPVLDVRVHEEYVAQTRRASNGTKKRASLVGARDEETVGPAAASVSAAPASIVKRMAASRSLARAIELRTQSLREAAAAAATVECPHCANVNARQRNYCVCCGLGLHGVSGDYCDHVLRGNGQPYQSSKLVHPITRYEDGTLLLATVATKEGKKMFLVCNDDKTQLKWVE